MNTLFFLVLLLAGPGGGSHAPPELVFGMTPVVGVEATRARFAPLAEYMSDQLGIPVRLLVADSYGSLIEKMVAGEVDLAKLSPLAYVRVRQQIPLMKLVATHVANGSATYSSYLVALQDNKFSFLEKLKGARICFADPDSTSGYLYPAAYLQSRGIDPGRDMTVEFAGDHRACLDRLFAGRCDIVATWAGAIRDARQSGQDVGELAIVAKTGRIPYDAYCVRPKLDEEITRRIQKLLLRTNTLSKTGRRVLSHTLGINGWVPGDDRVYDGIRQVEASVGETETQVKSDELLAVIPSMPISQLLGKTRADIETLFHPSKAGHAEGWVRYNEHLEVRYEKRRCVELITLVRGGLTCRAAARWVGFGEAMAPIYRAKKCVWPPDSLKHSLGKGVSGELILDGGVFRARLDP